MKQKYTPAIVAMVTVVGLTGLVATTSAFEMPKLDSISDFFHGLYKRETSDSGETMKFTEEDTERARIKRQSSDIGDESQLPYMIKSSR